MARRIPADACHAVLHPGAATDQRVQRGHHYRNSALRRCNDRLDMATRSRPWQTLLASLVALCGVAIIFGEMRANSDILGVALTCLMTVALGAMTVSVRRYKDTPMVAAAAWSNFLGSIVSIPFAEGITGMTGSDLFTLAMFGFFQVALGLTLFVLGSRLLPSGQASLIATLETPLMPFLIWLAFQEAPRNRGTSWRCHGNGRGRCRHRQR
jgi:hypothetical protein